MGRITNDPICSIAEVIISEQSLSHYIETGTYKGNSLWWALTHFTSIVTIEINKEYQDIAKSLYYDDRIKFILGDSRNSLSQEDLSTPSLIWLDAHSGGGNYDIEDNCPLIEELNIIMDSPIDHYIMIDDARAFCWPLASPFDYTKWPSLNDIFSTVSSRYWIGYIKDTFVLIPLQHKDKFQKLFSKL